jgi:nicotinamidase-related amidase
MSAELAQWIAPARTALLVIDMQRDFADVPGGAAALARAAELVAGARAAGVACIFTGLQTRPEADSVVWRERLARLGRDADREMNLCREGSKGAAFVGPEPKQGELVIAKQRYSAFSGTGLEAALRARRLDTLVVCGLTTEWCVAASARDAFERDFHVFVVGDACAETDPALHRAALAALDRQAAIIVETSAVLSAWGA